VGEEPDRIRAEIEQTRAEMSETVDALGYKADVKTRTKENLQDKKESAKESIMGVKDKIVGAGDSVTSKISDTGGSVTSTVSDRTPDAEDVKYRARQAKSVAQQNPIGLAIGSVAIGFLAGMLLPSTRVEDEKLGEASDNVIEKVKETGQEALEHGKQVAQDAAQSAQQTVKESGQEHAQQVKESAQQNVSSEPAQSTYTTH
jgi:gas vesicle protein